MREVQRGGKANATPKVDNSHGVSESSSESILQLAKEQPASLTPAKVMQLQRAYGNQAVQRMLAGVRKQQPPAQMVIRNGVSASKGYVVDDPNDNSSNKVGKLSRNDEDDNKMGGSVSFGSLGQYGYGTSMYATIFDWNYMPDGSSPSVKPNWYPAPNTKYWTSYMVQGHLLNDNVGGPGNDMRNLAPIVTAASH